MNTPVPHLGDRSLFPSLAARAYLNHAAISPPSLPVRDAVLQVVDSYAERGVGAVMDWIEQRSDLRAALARLVGGGADDIGLVANTTTGVIDLALCLPWRPGDRVVVFDGEFPTNVTPWQQAAAAFDLELVRLPLDGFGLGAEPTGDGLARVEAELRRGARLVAVSAVQFQTGLRMPLAELAELCHRHGAELFVDAIQALGIVPLDAAALGVDYLTCGSHKWLMGIEGCGFVYIRAELAGSLVPRVAGWLSHEDGLGFLFHGGGHLRYDRPIRQRADFLEVGAPNTAGLAALGASLGLVTALGVPAIFEHVGGLLDQLEIGLVDRGFTSLRSRRAEARSGILSLLPPDDIDVVALNSTLNACGIATSIPDGHLRMAPHWPNALGEVAVVLDAVDEAVGRLRA